MLRFRGGRRDWLRAGGCLAAGLVCASCTDPQFRDLDAGSQPDGSHADAAAEPPRDSGASDDASSQHTDPLGDTDAGNVETPEQLTQRMLGRYYMRLFFRADDPAAKPLTTGLSLVEFSSEGGVLVMREQPCHYFGQSLFATIPATTEFEASQTPPNRFELQFDAQSRTFDSDQPVVGLGYSLMQPAGCSSGQTLPTTTAEKPWLNNAPCTCPSDLSALPAAGSASDCRINDDDHDGAPGFTIYAQVQGFDKVAMHLVQRARDHYLDIHFKAASHDVLLGRFSSVRQNSVLGCDPMGPNCAIGAPPACAPEYSVAEWVRAPSAASWTCDALALAAANTDLFREAVPAACSGP
ncbi:MAG: hypothetical protein QM778_22705 [Myxococcales bacterium]